MVNASVPDVLIVARRVHVLGDHSPVEAVLVRNGKIAAVGAGAELAAATLRKPRIVSLPDAVITPGLTDAHVHLTAWALARGRIVIEHGDSLEETLERVRAAAARTTSWVLGLGWDLNRWGALPDRGMLDRVAPQRPVLLESHDVHAAWLNSEAMRRCGITRDTPEPEGGRIVRDAEGEPTGVLLENAKALALPHVPQPARAEIRAALVDAQAEALRHGITGVHSVEPTGLRDFGDLERAGELRLRVLQHLPLAQLEAATELGLASGWTSTDRGSPGRIRVGGVKMFLDGALGSRTAWMREPYEGTRDQHGIQTLQAEEFRAYVQSAADAGLPSAVHAIGDAATELALSVLDSVPAPGAVPHRIEHLQLCPPELWPRAGRSGIVASMQPVHLLSDIPAAERHWGERARGAYAFAPLLASGMTLAFGSDVPVETIDPRAGLYAAVRRVSWAGEPDGGWHPQNALSAEQALRGYTEGPASAAGLEDRQGRLLPGYDADLVAWDRDPLDCPADELRELGCLLTMVGGAVVHDARGDGG